jgi:hypothetical protein
MRLKLFTLSGSTLLLAATLLPTPSLADPFANPNLKPSVSPLQNARVDGINADDGTLSVTDCAQLKSNPNSRPICQGTAFNLIVQDAALKTKLKQFQLGDRIRVAFDPQFKVEAIDGAAVSYVSAKYRFSMLLVCFLVPLAIATLMTWGHPFKLIVGLDNRYSNSKLQAALWFWVLLATYLDVLYFRISVAGLDFLGGINIPQNLLLLSGMSAITFTGAKAITTAKVNAANVNAVNAVNAAAAPANKLVQAAAVAAVDRGADVSVVVPPAATADNIPPQDPKNSLDEGEESFWRDIVQNDFGNFDFGDFQMVIVTLLAICTYVLAVHHYVGAIYLTTTASLPDVDTTILSTFGLGQGAYLAKKAAGNIGTT